MAWNLKSQKSRIIECLELRDSCQDSCRVESRITEPWALLLEGSVNGHVSILFDAKNIENLRGGASLWCPPVT